MRTQPNGQNGFAAPTRRIGLSAVFTVIGMIGLLGAPALSASAQDQPPPPPGDFGGPGGPGGHGGFGGPGGPGGFRGGRPGGPGGMRPATLSHAPIEALASALNLSDDQQEKLREMQRSFREKEKSERQNSGFQPPRPGGPGEPPSESERQAFDAKRKAFDEKRDAQSRAADQEMAQILTDAQKKALPEVLKSLDALQSAGIPAPLQAELKLSADQRTKLAAIAAKYGPKPGEMQRPPQPGQRPDGNGGGRGRREQARSAVMAVLTNAQKNTITQWEAVHPRPQRGPGGFGGPGGPDDPPPPPPGE